MIDDLPFYIFQSYKDDRRVIMEGCVKCDSVYGWKRFLPAANLKTWDC